MPIVWCLNHQSSCPSSRRFMMKDSKSSASGYASPLSGPQFTIFPVSESMQYLISSQFSITRYLLSKPICLQFRVSSTTVELPSLQQASIARPYPSRRPYLLMNSLSSSLKTTPTSFSSSAIFSSDHPLQKHPKREFVDSIYIVSISVSHPNTSSNRIEMDPSLQNSLTE